MTKLKIYGKANPIVGVKEYYSIHDLVGQSISRPFANSNSQSLFEDQIKWSIWVLVGKSWIKMPKNNKTGSKVDYTFSHDSLTRKAIRMLVDVNGEKAVLDIVTQKTSNAKILHVELLDYNYNKPTKPFAYGDWIIARAHCVDMEFLPVKVSLWEDDGDKTKQNTTNVKIETKEADVLNGKADVAFYLNPSHAWLANAKLAPKDKDKGEGKFHEYYVTAEIFGKVSKRIPSKNADVPNPDYKPEVGTPAPKQPAPASKKQTPAQQKGPSKKEEKGIFDSVGSILHDYYETSVSVFSGIGESIVEKINSLMTINVDDKWWEKEDNCGEKYCIKKGDKNELIREVNIRLAGFGGNVPTDEFTDRTEKMIKQFQRDYMKVTETGKICGNVLRAIDDFSYKWIEKIEIYKCLCHASDSKVELKNRCLGYGKGEKNEHPGMHRTIMWGISALKFYLSQQKKYRYSYTSAGYRCWTHNRSIPRKTTNHMGKAVDIHFINGVTKMDGKNESNIAHLKKVRDNFYIKYLKAEEGWSIPSINNNYRLEPIGIGKDESFSWIHLDVSLFKTEFLNDVFFVKEQSLVIGKSILELANELGFKDTCNCNKINFKANDNKNSVNCETCKVMDKPRMDFYKQFGDASIELVKSKAKSNKFKGLYMVAQRRQENSFALKVPNNNPMNIKGVGDLGSKDIDTHEYVNGKKIYMKDKFANFSTVEKGFEGYLKQLDKNFNYAHNAILDDSKTIDDFLNGMQDTGKLGPYATDPNYKKLIKILFHGVVSDYKKWLNCKLTCSSHSSEVEKIKADIKLLEKLK